MRACASRYIHGKATLSAHLASALIHTYMYMLEEGK
jgi:hypothetical protein